MSKRSPSPTLPCRSLNQCRRSYWPRKKCQTCRMTKPRQTQNSSLDDRRWLQSARIGPTSTETRGSHAAAMLTTCRCLAVSNIASPSCRVSTILRRDNTPDRRARPPAVDNPRPTEERDRTGPPEHSTPCPSPGTRTRDTTARSRAVQATRTRPRNRRSGTQKSASTPVLRIS